MLVAAVIFLPLPDLTAQETEDDTLWPEIDRPQKTDPTSRKLMDLNLKARGGVEALEAIRNIRFDGSLVEGKNDYNITLIHARPDLLRQEVYRRHIGRDYRTVTGTAGKGTWRQTVLPEKELPRKMGGLDAQLFDLEARMPFMFMEQVMAGTTFVYRGEVRYANQPAYLLHGWLPTGLEIDIHLDAKSFHIINVRHPMKIGGKAVLVDRTPVGLKRGGEVWWESGHKVHIRAKVVKKIRSEKLQINVDLGEAAFSEPTPNEYWLRP